MTDSRWALGADEWPEPAEKFRLYVVSFNDDDNPERECWTLSPDPERLGWETDCSYPGYGLKKSIAQLIADVFNAHADLIF